MSVRYMDRPEARDLSSYSRQSSCCQYLRALRRHSYTDSSQHTVKQPV